MNVDELIETLEHNIERAEDDNWTVLCLNVKEGEELLKNLYKARKTLINLDQFLTDHFHLEN
mgnify:FL=1